MEDGTSAPLCSRSHLWWFPLVSSSVLKKWRSQAAVFEMGSCSPQMLHGVVLSPDYDGPCGTPLCWFTSHFQLAKQAGSWGGCGLEKVLSQPMRVSGGKSQRPHGRMDNRWNSWMELGKPAVMENGWMEFLVASLSQTLRGRLGGSDCHCLILPINLVNLLQKGFFFFFFLRGLHFIMGSIVDSLWREEWAKIIILVPIKSIH